MGDDISTGLNSDLATQHDIETVEYDFNKAVQYSRIRYYGIKNKDISKCKNSPPLSEGGLVITISLLNIFQIYMANDFNKICCRYGYWLNAKDAVWTSQWKQIDPKTIA